MSEKCQHCGGPQHPLERCPPRRPAAIEGRVFALTGPEMLELANLLEEVVRCQEMGTHLRPMVPPAQQWANYLRREHKAHFGEEGDNAGTQR